MTARHVFIIVPMLLAGCGGAPSDNTGNVTDPAVAEAINQPILTDPQLRASTAPDALRPQDQPAMLAPPAETLVDVTGAPTLGEVAAAQSRTPAFSGCSPAISYSAQWSLRFPDLLALPEHARLAEAAGSTSPTCALRIMRFALPSSPAETLDRYAALAAKSGYAVARAGNSLTATQSGNGAFHIDVTAIRDGTRIDLISNRGR